MCAGVTNLSCCWVPYLGTQQQTNYSSRSIRMCTPFADLVEVSLRARSLRPPEAPKIIRSMLASRGWHDYGQKNTVSYFHSRISYASSDASRDGTLST